MLTIEGHHLDAGEVRIRFTRIETGEAIELAPDAPPAPERITVALPGGSPLGAGDALAGTGADPGTWRIGVYMVDVVLSDASANAARTRTTNRLPLTLAPRATSVASAEPGGTRIVVTSQPAIRRGQSVSLIVGVDEAVLPAPATDVDRVEALFAGLVPGATLPVRLRVRRDRQPDRRSPRPARLRSIRRYW